MNPWLASAALAARSRPRAVTAGDLPAVRPPQASLDLQSPKVHQQLLAYRNAVYKAVRFLANQVSKVDRYVVTVTLQGQGAEIEERRRPMFEHPVTRMFRKGARGRPNPWQTSGNFIAQIVLDLGTTGAFRALKVHGDGDEPDWLLRLRPDWIRIVPDPKVGIAGYSFRPGGIASRPLVFAPAEIVDIRFPSPLDERVGWSPLRSLAYGADLGDEIRRFQWQFFEQGARIDGIVTGAKNTEEIKKVYDLLLAGHYAGADSAWLPAVMPAGLTFTPTQQTAKDFEFAALAGFAEDDILEGYGVPKPLLGNAKAVPFANLRSLMIIAVENGITPLLRTIEEHIEKDLLADFPGQSDRNFLEFDFEDPLPGDPEQERKALETDLKLGVRTINEERSNRNEPPVPWGEAPWLPINVLQPGSDGEGDDDDGRGWLIAPGGARALTGLLGAQPALIAGRQDPITLAMVDAALRAALGPEADAQLIARLRPRLLQALLAGAVYEAGVLEVETMVLEGTAIVEQYLAEHIPKLVRVNDWTRRRIRNIVAETLAAGVSPTEQAQALRTEFRAMRVGRRAMTVARTESGIAWHRGVHGQMVGAATPGHIWIASRDLRVRDSHQIDNQCRALEEPFLLRSGIELLHPHDAAGPPEEIINCRCTTAPAPTGCEGRQGWLVTEIQRAVFWRATIAALAGHERGVVREMRRLWARQEDAFFAALAEAA